MLTYFAQLYGEMCEGEYSLKDLPCGWSLTFDIMKFAKRQNSWASTFNSLSSSSMTFSASSMLAWCLYVVVVVDAAFLVVSVVRIASRCHLARPAVEFRVLLQTIFTPPVEEARTASCPPVTSSSSSVRKSLASWNLLVVQSSRMGIKFTIPDNKGMHVYFLY